MAKLGAVLLLNALLVSPLVCAEADSVALSTDIDSASSSDPSYVSVSSSSSSSSSSLSSSSSTESESESVPVRGISGCSFGDIDLSNLNSNTDITGSDSTFNYYMNMCGVVNNAECIAAKPGAMVCQNVIPGQGSGLYALAYFQVSGTLGGTWSYLNGAASNGAQVVYQNGDGDCYNFNTGQTEQRVLTMQFKCQDKADAALAFSTSSNDPCQYSLVYGTPYACPGAGGGGGGGSSSDSSGLSGGWVFIIILLVGAFVYILGGCIYKAKQLGAVGMERMPNIEFWREVPGLVKDGCRFTSRKISDLVRGRSSSGGTSGGYQDI